MSIPKRLVAPPSNRLSLAQSLGLVVGVVAVVLLGSLYVMRGRAAATTFRFAAFSDTKTGTAALTTLSPQIMAMNPVFGMYPGDVCDAGPEATCFATWKTALNGGNTNALYDRMFVTRGNHDSAGAAFWAATFNFSAMAARLGATNYTGDNFTYSFDYGNSHFVMLDAPGGDSPTISASQVTWVDNDLAAAESRGVVHSFATWHGPIHPEGGHCCTDDPRFITMFGRHPSFAAVFSGHEHNLGSTLMDSRWGNTGHPFYEIITGGAGAGLYACQSGRADYCNSTYGFSMIDVNGADVTINIYKSGSTTPLYTSTLTAGSTATPVPNTPTPVATPSPTPAGLVGDVNANGKVDVFDLSLLLGAWNSSNAAADVNHDGTVNVFDLSTLLSHWTG